MLSYIIAITIIVLVFAYFKSLSPALRKEQASVIRDTATIGIVATAKFSKEAMSATYKTGTLVAKTIEAEHAETSHKARQGLDTFITNNGGSVEKAGEALGSQAANAVYLSDANTALDKALADLKAKGF